MNSIFIFGNLQLSNKTEVSPLELIVSFLRFHWEFNLLSPQQLGFLHLNNAFCHFVFFFIQNLAYDNSIPWMSSKSETRKWCKSKRVDAKDDPSMSAFVSTLCLVALEKNCQVVKPEFLKVYCLLFLSTNGFNSILIFLILMPMQESLVSNLISLSARDKSMISFGGLDINRCDNRLSFDV